LTTGFGRRGWKARRLRSDGLRSGVAGSGGERAAWAVLKVDILFVG
jgi:hypothetical protein